MLKYGYYLHLVVSHFIISSMNFTKIFYAVLAALIGIGADWFAIVWSIRNDIPPMYMTIAILIITSGTIGVIIWDLRS